jgi:hypothetical protein
MSSDDEEDDVDGSDSRSTKACSRLPASRPWRPLRPASRASRTSSPPRHASLSGSSLVAECFSPGPQPVRHHLVLLRRRLHRYGVRGSRQERLRRSAQALNSSCGPDLVSQATCVLCYSAGFATTVHLTSDVPNDNKSGSSFYLCPLRRSHLQLCWPHLPTRRCLRTWTWPLVPSPHAVQVQPHGRLRRHHPNHIRAACIALWFLSLEEQDGRRTRGWLMTLDIREQQDV